MEVLEYQYIENIKISNNGSGKKSSYASIERSTMEVSKFDISKYQSLEGSKYRLMEASRYRLCKYRNIEMSKYTSIEIYRTIELSKYASRNIEIPSHGSTGISTMKASDFRHVEIQQLSNYRSMELSEYRNVEIAKYRNIEIWKYRSGATIYNPGLQRVDCSPHAIPVRTPLSWPPAAPAEG